MTVRDSSRALGLLLLGLALPATTATARADAKAVCIGAFDQAQSLQADRRYSEARDQFVLCARTVCPRSLQRECGEKLARVEDMIPSLVFAAKDSSGQDMTKVTVTVDGTAVATELDGKAVTVDPGPHTVRFVAEGVPPVERRLVVAEGQHDQLVSVELAAAGTASAERPGVVASATPESPSSAIAFRTVGLVAAGAGVVGIGLGAVFGLMAKSKWDDAKSSCGAGCAVGSPAYDSQGSAKTDATVSTVAVIAGGLLVAGGVTLYVLNPSPGGSNGTPAAVVQARLSPTLGGLRVDGCF